MTKNEIYHLRDRFYKTFKGDAKRLDIKYSNDTKTYIICYFHTVRPLRLVFETGISPKRVMKMLQVGYDALQTHPKKDLQTTTNPTYGGK